MIDTLAVDALSMPTRGAEVVNKRCSLRCNPRGYSFVLLLMTIGGCYADKGMASILHALTEKSWARTLERLEIGRVTLAGLLRYCL